MWFISRSCTFSFCCARLASKTCLSRQTPLHYSIVYTGIRTKMATSNASLKRQQFDYFLVLDFEATCDNQTRLHPQEIIEFPCLKFNAKTLQIDATFHQYVQPQVHKMLTPFCTELTGITQDMVDEQPNFEQVLESFDKWMKSAGLLDDGVTSVFVTCGDWDLKSMLPRQCRYFRVNSKEYFNKWINIKKSFADFTGIFPKGMMPMLNFLKLKHQGRLHSGIDDSKNIANILKGLLEQGSVLKPTGFLEKGRN